LQAKQAHVPLPHARYDCPHIPHADGKEAQHCEHCWCCLCEKAAASCQSWVAHCKTTASEDAARSAAKRQAALRSKIDAVQRLSPPPLGSPTALLQLDFRWLQLRHVALSWMANCGCDEPSTAEDGLTTTLVAACDATLDLAQQVIAVLVATNELVSIDEGLHLRHDIATLGRDPMPPGPPGPQLHEWIAQGASGRGALPPDKQALIHSRATNQAAQQWSEWTQYYTAAKVAAQRAPGGAPWVSFYEQQAREQAKKQPQLLQQLMQAWTRYTERGGS